MPSAEVHSKSPFLSQYLRCGFGGGDGDGGVEETKRRSEGEAHLSSIEVRLRLMDESESRLSDLAILAAQRR